MDIARFDRLRDTANNDPEFRIAARFWNSALRFEMGDAVLHLRLVDGRVSEVSRGRPTIELLTPSNLCVAASAEEWQKLLQPIPKPFYADLWSATAHHGFVVAGDMEMFYAYYPAVRRLIDLMRTLAHDA